MNIREFDADFYLNQWEDVNTAILNGTFAPVPGGTVADQAEAHFNLFGAEEGRNPNAQFDETFYLEQNPDVAQAVDEGVFFQTGFDHFQNFGAREERLPSQEFADFNEQAYLDAWPDVAEAVEDGNFESGFQHFLLFGSAEGRPAPGVDIVPGETIALTTEDDVAGPAAGANLQTTPDDDTISGTVSALTSERTLNAGDEIDGAGGNDTLDVSLLGRFGGFTGDGGVVNVENIVITNESTIARTFNAEGIEGAEQYTLNSGGARISELTGLDSTDASIVVNDQASGGLTIGFAGTVADGGGDVLSLTLNNVGTVNDPATQANEEDAAAFNIADIEILDITTSGTNVVDLSGAGGVETIAFAGPGPQKITGVPDTLTQFDASGKQGNVRANLSGADNVLTASTGAGNDVVYINNANRTVTAISTAEGDDAITVDARDLTTDAIVAGGPGNDRLNLSTTGQATTQYNMTGIQTVALGAIVGGLTFSAANATGVQTIEATNELNGAANFAGLGGADIGVRVLGENSAENAAVSSNHSGATTLTVQASDETLEDDEASPETNATDVTLTQSSNVNLNVSESMNYTGTLTANNANAFNAAGAGALNGTLNLGSVTSASIATGDGSTVVINAANLEDLSITAGSDFTIDGESNLNSLLSLTADVDGNFTVESPLNSVETLTADVGGALTTSNFGGLNVANLTVGGAANLGALGAGDQDFGLTVNASGMADGLTIASMNVGAGQSIAINAADTTGNITLSNGAAVAGGGSISVDLDGASGETLNLGTLTASNVTIEAAGADGTLTANVEADTASVTGSGLGENTIAVTAGESADVTGGIEAETLTVTAAGGTTGGVVDFTLTGDLGSDIFAINAGGADSGAVRAVVTDFEGDRLGGESSSASSALADEDAIAAFLSDALATSLEGGDVGGLLQPGDADNAAIFEFGGQVHVVAGSGDTAFNDGDIFVTLAGVSASDIDVPGGIFA